jgi:pentapeptide repeat protein
MLDIIECWEVLEINPNSEIEPLDYTDLPLSEKDLRKANISTADFSLSKFRGAAVYQANFFKTKISRADMTNVKGLTAGMLSQAIYDEILIEDSDTTNTAVRDDAKQMRKDREEIENLKRLLDEERGKTKPKV